MYLVHFSVSSSCWAIVAGIQRAKTKTTMQGYFGRYSGCNDNRNYNARILWETFSVQRQQKLQCRAIVGDIQGATTTETTMQEIFGVHRQQKLQCWRYSRCNDNRNHNVGLLWEIFRVQRQQKLQCRRYLGNAGDIQGATTETTMQGHCEKNQGATTTETTMQGYCERYSGCKDSRNYNAELLWEIFRVQRQQKLQCRAIAEDIPGAATTKTTM